MSLSPQPISILLIIMLSWAMPAWALNKCTDPTTGAITYSDQPCPQSTSREELDIQNNRNIDLPPRPLVDDADDFDDPVLSIIRQRGLRPGEEARLFDIEMQERVERDRRDRNRRMEEIRQELQAQFDKQDEKYNQAMCAMVKGRIEKARDELRAGYHIARGETLRKRERRYREIRRTYCQ